jgi:hypothetical protein
MTTRWINDKVDAYRSELPPDDLSDFNNRYEDMLESLSLEEVRDDLENEYQRSEEHLELIIATASGFHQTELADGYSSGYEFAITEPLEELNSFGEEEVTNGDVLLVKETDKGLYLCIVECKAGGNAGGQWVTELHEIKCVIETEEYKRELKSQIGAKEKQIKHTQYALLGKIIPIHSMNFEKLADDMDIPSDFAFWGYDISDQAMVHVHGEVRDKSLAETIKDSVDAGKVENPLKFTFGDHTLTQLKILIEEMIKEKKDKGDDHPFEFLRSEFQQQFNGHLEVGFTDARRSEAVTRQVDHLLDVGLKIGIFVGEGLNSSRDYRIYFRGSKYHVAKAATEEKYLDVMSAERKKERAFKKVRESFTPKQTRLDDRWNTDNDDNDA